MARFRVLEATNFVATELHKSFSPLFNPKITPEWRAAVVDNITKKIEMFQTALGDKDYIAGEFSIADAYAFTIPALGPTGSRSRCRRRSPRIAHALARGQR